MHRGRTYTWVRTTRNIYRMNLDTATPTSLPANTQPPNAQSTSRSTWQKKSASLHEKSNKPHVAKHGTKPTSGVFRKK